MPKVICVILFLCSRVWAQSADVLDLEIFKCLKETPGQQQDSVLKLVEKRYQDFSDLRAKFRQSSYFVGLNQKKTSIGVVAFKKPGMMDWLYQEPEKQRFVADGKTLSFYQPDLNQVTVGDFNSSFSSDLPVSFLLGLGVLRDKFELSSACYSKSGLVLNLRPRKVDVSLDQFSLLVRADDYLPVGAKIVDAGGNETEITFEDVVLNTRLEDKAFVLDLPKGVDVIDQRKLAVDK